MDKMTDQEVELMKSSTTERAWNANCDAVKVNHGGRYPDDWFAKIVVSGVMHETAAAFVR